MLIYLLRKLSISTEPWLLACQLCDCFFFLSIYRRLVLRVGFHTTMWTCFFAIEKQCPPRGTSRLSQKV